MCQSSRQLCSITKTGSGRAKSRTCRRQYRRRVEMKLYGVTYVYIDAGPERFLEGKLKGLFHELYRMRHWTNLLGKHLLICKTSTNNLLCKFYPNFINSNLHLSLPLKDINSLPKSYTSLDVPCDIAPQSLLYINKILLKMQIHFV